MTPADRTPDDPYAASYDAVRRRLAALPLGELSGTPVPACPGWCVRDVVAHLAGLCQDWVENRFDGYASDAWTTNQVTRFAELSSDEIFQVWSHAAVAFAELDPDTFIGSPPRWAFGDAVVHEADIRGATNQGRVPPEAVALSLRGSVARWREVLQFWHVPTLVVRCPDREWRLGQREEGTSDDEVVVETSAYDLFRALAGRRSTSQVRAWSWSDDPQPFLDAGLAYPFKWATLPLVD